jgi:hypothetical protein
MKQYIDKEAAVAEIKKRFDEYSRSILKHYDACKEAKAQELGKILTILDTLETKEVDLEKEYEEFVVDDPILGNFITNDTMGMVLAKHFFELGLRSSKEPSPNFTENMDKKIQQYLLLLVKPLWEDTLDNVGLKKDDIIAWIEKKVE